MTPPVLWTPPDSLLQRCALGAFRRERGFDTYDELWQWSVTDLEGFWGALWDRYGLGERGAVLASEQMPGAQWFPGTQVNYAEQVFRDKDGLALIAGGEDRADVEWSWAQLRALTARIATGLRALGVQRGDRVAAYMPNIPETAAAFLACASLGAVWSSCSPDFGPRSVIDRFAQIEPKVLLAVRSYRYNGREFDRSEALEEITAAMDATTVILGEDSWAELVRGSAELRFERVSFDHPLWVLYSSGTTGLPKAIVQSQGGILLEHLKMLHLHVDAQRGDRLFWFTTTGWMMWNFIVSGLLTEATILLYDGSPGYPDMGALWDFAARTRMTTFGTSASYLGACMKAGVEPGEGRDLSALRAVGSTGSPLSPEGFRWVYEHVGADTWLFSTSGGTDLCTAFVGGVPELPVYEGELQGRALGAAVESWDPDGKPLIGEVGELVVTEPMPSMPIYFWGDDDGSRYREAYFDVYPGVWRHGDWITVHADGSCVVTGRSDATLNRGGVRLGTAEFYSVVEGLPEVSDSLVVHLADDRLVLFVVLAPGADLAVVAPRIRAALRSQLSPRHAPDEVHAVAAVPRTLSGKKLEVPVKRILGGTPVDRAVARGALANPDA